MEYYEVPGVKPGPFPKQIEKREMPFSMEEYLGRLEHVQQLMAARGLDTVIITDPSNMCYLTGFAASSSYVAQGLIFHAGDVLPHFYLRRQDAPAAMHMTIVPNERIHGYAERYIGDCTLSGFDVMFDAISQTPSTKSIGLELGAVAADAYATITKRFGQFDYSDVSGELEQVRLIKSDAEQDYLRAAGKLTQSVALSLGDIFQEGRYESDVAADISAALFKGFPGKPGEPSDYLLMPGGKQTGTSHITWTERKIEAGMHYNVEFAAARHRYHAPIMRTVSIGQPAPKLERMYGYMVEGCNAALATVAPGKTCADVAKTYCAVLDRGGYWKDSRCGYPIGINWMETSCSLRVDDPTQLQPGMAFHLMLGTWLEEDFGAVISESFIVTDTGHELLSDVPRDIITAT
ncbi:MAG: Xaa-Pro peptidase family protein [Pseudomonadota bacterium]